MSKLTINDVAIAGFIGADRQNEILENASERVNDALLNDTTYDGFENDCDIIIEALKTATESDRKWFCGSR